MKKLFKRLLSVFGLAASVFLMGPSHLHAQTTRLDRENGIKAGFIIGFSDFIKWDDPELNNSKELKIGVLGKGPLTDTLEKAIRSKSSSKRPISLHHFQSVDEINDINMLFVFKDQYENWPEVHLKCTQNSILSISDQKDFASNGGMIEIVRVGNRIKFIVNNITAKESGISISSKLIRLSHGGPR